jgi:hypothetical protein
MGGCTHRSRMLRVSMRVCVELLFRLSRHLHLASSVESYEIVPYVNFLRAFLESKGGT